MTNLQHSLAPEDDATVRESLATRGFGGISSSGLLYQASRQLDDGTTQHIEVQIVDNGPDNPRARYQWRVRVPGAEVDWPINANVADSIYAAGVVPHWSMLDTPPRRNAR